ncbi:MAG: hypothetical protein B7X41_18580 [Microbacterium sp. 14-71-5]|nr:MAG: hypothetical protein B7X41_18580 [Microbacterium sp. 14-71-5]
MTSIVQPGSWSAFAGVDWGGSEHQVCIVDRDGRRLIEHRVNHDVVGLGEIGRTLVTGGVKLPVAVERSEGLLVEHLLGLGLPVGPDPGSWTR